MTEKEMALAGMEFVRGDKDLKRQRECAEMLCFTLNHTSPQEEAKRQEILAQLIGDMGEDCYIKSPFLCEYGEYISLGKHFFANYNCKLRDRSRQCGSKRYSGRQCSSGKSLSGDPQGRG